MTKDEALDLSLEALEHLQPTALTSFYTIGVRDKAITAIKQALAAHVQEPVGEVGWGGTVNWHKNIPDFGTDLYTTPPAQSAHVQDEAWKAEQKALAAEAIKCATETIADADGPINEVREYYGAAQPAPVPDGSVSKGEYNRLRDDYNDLVNRSEQDAKDAKQWRKHVNHCQLQGVDLDYQITTPPAAQPAVPLTMSKKMGIAELAATRFEWSSDYIAAIAFVIEQCEAAHGITEKGGAA